MTKTKNKFLLMLLVLVFIVGSFAGFSLLNARSALAETHEHNNFKYETSGATITATCQEQDCGFSIQAELKANDKGEVTIYNKANFEEATGGSFLGNITYFDSSTQLNTAPTAPGNYSATVLFFKVSPYTLTLAYEILGTPVITTAPVAKTNLTYTGSQDTLIIPGAVSNGTLFYRVSSDNGSTFSVWSQSIPQAKDVNATDYIIEYYVKGAEHYKNLGSDTEALGTLTTNIAPVTVGLNWELTAEDLVYSATAKTVKATATGLVGDEQCGVNVALTTGNDNINVGTFTFTATGLTGDFAKNYVLPTNKVSSEYEITPMEVELNWGTLTFVYNGNPQKPTCTISTTLKGLDVCTVSVEGAKTDVGTGYTATATLDGANKANYKIKSGDETETFEITPKTVALIWTDDDGETVESDKILSWEYDGESHAPTCAIADGSLIGTDTCDVTVKKEKNANNYFVPTYTTVVTLSNPNYKTDNSTRKFTITQKVATLEWGTAEFVYDGKAHVPTATIKLGEGTTESQLIVVVIGEETNAGTYTATAIAIIGNDNYRLSTVKEEYTKEFKITQKVIDINWCEDDFVYGDAQTITATYTNVSGQEIALAVTTDKTFMNAGDYVATASRTDGDIDENYKLPTLEDCQQTFTIAPLYVEVIWEYTEFTYNGEVQTITAYYYDVNFEKIDLAVTTDEEFKDAGTYWAEADFVVEDANYVLTYNMEYYRIAPMTINVIWSEDNFVYNGETQTISATFADENEDEQALDVIVLNYNGIESLLELTSVASVDFKDAGEYIAIAGFAVENNNYDFGLDSTDFYKIFTMKQKELQATWTTTSFEYDKTLKTPVVTLTGVETGDECEAIVSGEEIYVGTYNAKIVGLTNDNYILTSNLTNTFEITPLKIAKPVADTTNFVYTGSALTYTLTANADYVIYNNTRTEAGRQNVVVVLRDQINTCWADGSVADLTFDFCVKQDSIDRPVDAIYGNILTNSGVVIIDTQKGILPEWKMLVDTKNVDTNKVKDALTKASELAKNEKIYNLYNVGLLNGETTVQPDGTVTLKIFVDSQAINKDFRLYQVTGEQVNEITSITKNVEEGFITITVPSLSNFVIVADVDCNAHWISIIAFGIFFLFFILYFFVFRKHSFNIPYLIAMILALAAAIVCLSVMVYGCLLCILFSCLIFAQIVAMIILWILNKKKIFSSNI